MPTRSARTRSSAARRGSAPAGTWAGRDLLQLRGVPKSDLIEILSRARELSPSQARDSEPTLAGRTVATMFFEESTRTKTSFTLAAERLGARVADLTAGESSVKKGETLTDTALTLGAMGVDAMVVRSRFGGATGAIAEILPCPVINAGDGRNEHPTQGLLDVLTIAQAHGRDGTFDLRGLTVAIVGDIASSRVARSTSAAAVTLGARVVCVGPAGMAPKSFEFEGCTVSHDFDGAIGIADAVVMLRIQFERYGLTGEQKDASKGAAIASVREYRELYGLTAGRAAAMKQRAVVMHPGPMNRGIEIDAVVADGPKSVILRQVANGVAVRAAVLEGVMGARR